MTQEELQQREFLTGQGDAGGAARHLAADQIDAEIGRLKLAFDDDRRPAAQQSTHPRQQLRKGERFYQIVVSAQLQPLHPMLNGAQRGKQQDRHAFPGGAQHAHDIPAVHIRQHDVEDQQIVIAGHRQVIAVEAVIGQVDDEAGLGEPFGQVLSGFLLIFDNQNLHGRLLHARFVRVFNFRGAPPDSNEISGK